MRIVASNVGAMPSPYYERSGIVIYCGDCREILPTLEVGAALITDPPYGATSLHWDQWVSGWLPIVREPTLWCFGSFRMYVDRASEFTTAGWKLAQDVVWEKHNGSSPLKDRFRRVHELVVHWYRGPWSGQLQQTPKTLDATRRQVRRKRRPPHWGRIEESAYESHDGGPRLARSVQRFRSEHGRAEHPTPKPPPLIELLVEYSTRPGDLVVDPFCGGGATLVACARQGRRAVGIEVDERWCEASARALEAA